MWAVNTKEGNQLERVILALGLVGVISALFLFGVTYGLGAGQQLAIRENKFFPIGYNPYEDMAYRFLLILILFILNAPLTIKRRGFIPKALSSLVLGLVIHQSVILTLSKPGALPSWMTEYSGHLGGLLYADYFFLLIAVASFLLQIFSIWQLLSSRSPELESGR